MKRVVSFLLFITKILSVSLLILFVGVLIFNGKTKTRTPPENAVNISFPLKNGPYFVNQNGPSGTTHQQPQEKYAMDIIKGISSFGSFQKKNLNDFPIFGDPIYSPCYGNVKELSDGNIDNVPGITSGQTNKIVIGCNGFDVYIAHIKKGSFKVKVGQVVKETDILAQFGNSGNSTEPHLHIMAYHQDKEGNQTPLPLLLNGKYYLKDDTIATQ